MKIAVIGRGHTLMKTAQQLQKQGHTITLVVTAKAAPEYQVKSADYERWAQQIQAAYLYTPLLNQPQNISYIQQLGKIDIAISMNYVQILNQEVIQLFRCGVLNAHAGDLPRYQGNACPAWAILQGEERMGLCIHQMVGSKLDEGDIVARNHYSLHENTKVGELYEWIDNKIPELFQQAIKQLEINKEYYLERSCNDPSKALRCYPLQPEDGLIDFSRSNIEIHRTIRAFNEPFHGAFCFFNDKKLILWDSQLYDDGENYLAVPGQVATILPDDEAIIVITGEGKLRINEVEYEGHRIRPTEIIRSIRLRLHSACHRVY